MQFIHFILHLFLHIKWITAEELGHVFILTAKILIIAISCIFWSITQELLGIKFLGFSAKLLQGVYITFKKVFINFEIVHTRTCTILAWCGVQFLLINSKTLWPIIILVPFLSFSDNLLQDAYITFLKKYWQFWDSVQDTLNFGLEGSSSLRG